MTDDSAAPAIDLSGLDAAEMAEAVGGMSDEQLGEVMTSELRAAALDEVFRRFPEFVDPARTKDVEAAIEWTIGGPGKAEDRFLVVLDHGECRAGRDLEDEPSLTLELDAVDFLRLVTGSGNPAAMFITGRLKVSGDSELAMNVASFFRIPGGGEGDGPAVDPSAVDAEAMARIIGGADDAALKEGMRSPFRDLVLGEIFRRFPEYMHTERTKGLHAVVKFKVGGRADGESDRWLVFIDDGSCRAERDGDAEARTTISMDGHDFLKLVTGNSNPTMTFMKGKLRVHGDLMFAAQLAGLFKIPGSN
ncbi:MAG: SCP2 sterol-binding domain-containing protein [Thermoleophilaceae bacterium]